MPTVHYRAADIGALKVSYREAGGPNAPTLLLLHGFPTAGAHVPRFNSSAHRELSPGCA